MMSGRSIPAAATLISTSPAAGTGTAIVTGRSDLQGVPLVRDGDGGHGGRRRRHRCWCSLASVRALMPEQAGGDKHRSKRPHLARAPSLSREVPRGMRDNEERPMDWDEVRAKPKPGAAIGENLETLSVAELEARIAELEREIARAQNGTRGQAAARGCGERAVQALITPANFRSHLTLDAVLSRAHSSVRNRNRGPVCAPFAINRLLGLGG